jgi:hypothetical protein
VGKNELKGKIRFTLIEKKDRIVFKDPPKIKY